MEKTYNNISYFFIAIWITALVGFHLTYTVFLPDFKAFTWMQHFHGAMLMAWFFMLIVQPFLIKYKKYEWHRTIGKLGYILAPLVVISIFEVTKMVYFREVAHRPENEVLSQLSLDIPAIFTFAFFAAMAFIYKKKSATHMRYMIATSLLMIGPGLGRALIIFGGIPFPVSVSVVLYLATFLSLVFLFFDWRAKRDIKPFTTITIAIAINLLCWVFQTSAWWVGFAKGFVQLFFS